MTSQRIPVSVILLTKNEERVLPRTLTALERFDEVFVIDSASADRTVEIAEAAGATVIQFSWDGAYPKKKEWALLHAPTTHDWVLYLDADEIVSSRLADEIATAAQDHSPYAAFDVALDYWFLGKQLKHGHKVTKRILLRKSRTKWPHLDDLEVANMWEVEGHYQPSIDGRVGELSVPLTHDDPDPLFGYFSRHNRYSDWEAHLRVSSRARQSARGTRSKRGQRYEEVPFKPLAFFVYSFILRKGFLDGPQGFHYAVAHAFYFWQISVKARDLRRASND